MHQNSIAIGLKAFAGLIFLIGTFAGIELGIGYKTILGIEVTSIFIWLLYLFALITTMFFLGLSELIKLNQEKLNEVIQKKDNLYTQK